MVAALLLMTVLGASALVLLPRNGIGRVLRALIIIAAVLGFGMIGLLAIGQIMAGAPL